MSIGFATRVLLASKNLACKNSNFLPTAGGGTLAGTFLPLLLGGSCCSYRRGSCWRLAARRTPPHLRHRVRSCKYVRSL